MTIPYLTDGHLILDNSGLSAIKTCPTYGKHRLIDRRERTGTSAKGRGPGKAVHSALELRYRVAGARRPTDEHQQMIDELLTEQMRDAQPAPGDEYLSLARLQMVMRAYRDGCSFELGVRGKNGVYNFAGYGDEPFQVLWVELPFACRLGEVPLAGHSVPVIWIGKSDLGIRMSTRGELMVCDHKTARKYDQATLAFWQMASGPKGYAACIPQWVREGLGGLPGAVASQLAYLEPERERLAAAGVGDPKHPINGFLLNALVIRDVTDLSRAKQPPTAFHRHQVFYRPGALDEWRRDTLRWCQTWLEWCEAGHWPMNDAHCTSLYGMTCPYYGVCSMPESQRELVLSTDEYQDMTWSPLVVDTSTGAWADKLLRVGLEDRTATILS